MLGAVNVLVVAFAVLAGVAGSVQVAVMACSAPSASASAGGRSSGSSCWGSAPG
jgi:hypothetical protein